MHESHEYPKVWMDENRIIHLELGRGQITAEHLRRANMLHRRLTTIPHPVLVYTVAGDSVSTDKEAMCYCSNPEVAEVTAAVAMVATSFIEKYMAKVFLTFYHTPYPCHAFGSKEEAIAWLKKHVPEQDGGPGNHAPDH